MLYAILPDESYLSAKNVLKIENEKINVELASTEAQRVSSTFLAKCQSSEGVVISSSPQFDEDVLKQLITEFINSTGGASESLFSARELNEEPKCLLSGDFLCSEVVAKSSLEIIEYFKQATRHVCAVKITICIIICTTRKKNA